MNKRVVFWLATTTFRSHMLHSHRLEKLQKGGAMLNYMNALATTPKPKKRKISVSRVTCYRANVAAKARAFTQAHAELSARSGSCYDVGSMTRIDGSMSRAEAVAALLGISLEAAAAML